MMTTRRYQFIGRQILACQEEAAAPIMEFIAGLDRASNEAIKRMHGDNAKQFLTMKKRLVQMSIELNTTSTHTLELIGLAERMNQTLIYNACALLRETRFPQHWLGEAPLQ